MTKIFKSILVTKDLGINVTYYQKTNELAYLKFQKIY